MEEEEAGSPNLGAAASAGGASAESPAAGVKPGAVAGATAGAATGGDEAGGEAGEGEGEASLALRSSTSSTSKVTWVTTSETEFSKEVNSFWEGEDGLGAEAGLEDACSRASTYYGTREWTFIQESAVF